MAVMFFILWIILNGRITLEIVLFGIVIAVVFEWFAIKVFGRKAETDIRIVKNLPILIHYILVLVVEIMKASVEVLKVAFSGRKKPEPYIFEFHSGFSDSFRNVLLANSITLTPGTYTVFLEGDRFVIHCLRKEYAEGMGDSRFVRILQKMR